jgi:lipopolysaccharide transport protein LptA
MAASYLRAAASAALMAAAALPALAADQAATTTSLTADRSTLPITVEADSSDFDYRNEALRFTKVRITQGDVRVEAAGAVASGLNFEASRWQFEGAVRITVPGGFLVSDSATVEFKANRITRADIAGQPAQFEQQRNDQLARGRARRIDYDLASGNVRLEGDAWLTDGRNEINGPSLVYDLGAQRVVANSGQGDQRVRITIKPQPVGDRKDAPAPDKPPPPP